MAFEEPHKAYTLLAAEAPLGSIANTHARLILELTRDIHAAWRRTKYLLILMQMGEKKTI